MKFGAANIRVVHTNVRAHRLQSVTSPRSRDVMTGGRTATVEVLLDPLLQRDRMDPQLGCDLLLHLTGTNEDDSRGTELGGIGMGTVFSFSMTQPLASRAGTCPIESGHCPKRPPSPRLVRHAIWNKNGQSVTLPCSRPRR